MCVYFYRREEYKRVLSVGENQFEDVTFTLNKP